MKKFITICCLWMMTSLTDMAQEEELGVEAPDPGSSVPVDGGLTLLLAAGTALGAKKLHRHIKNNRQEEG